MINYSVYNIRTNDAYKTIKKKKIKTSEYHI